MPSPRRRAGSRSTLDKHGKRIYPPAPPRWAVRSYNFNIVNGSLVITLTTDIQNVLTLAWTYDKPPEKTRNILRPRYPTRHSITYTLNNVNFTAQEEITGSFSHTFILPVKGGCFNLYMAGFDGTAYQAFHSISPIFALSYCATPGAALQGAYWEWPNNPLPFAPPFDVIYYDLRQTPQPVVPPTGAGFSVTALLPLMNLTYSEWRIHPAPCIPLATYTAHAQIGLLHIYDSLYSINQIGLSGTAVAGAKPGVTPHVTAEVWTMPNPCLGPVNVEVALPPGPLPGQLIAGICQGWGGVNMTMLPPYTRDIDTFRAQGPQVAPIVHTDTDNLTADCFAAAAVYSPQVAVFQLQDITPHWRQPKP